MSSDNLSINNPVMLTEQAVREINETLHANKIPDYYGIRVGMKGGGCSGTLILGFDTKQEFDNEYQIGGVKVFIDKRHLMYVLGAKVDYEDTNEASGFTINLT